MLQTLKKKSVGYYYEQRAEKFLCKQGLIFCSRNYHCKMGEIDLIMRDKQTFVFVEVRYRASMAFGGALASVHAQKQAKIRQAAQHFFVHQKLNIHQQFCRFDIVAFENHQPHWIQSAF